MSYGPATQNKIDEVVGTCNRYGSSSVIALSGVPSTGKSHVAIIAAQEHAGDPTRVREIQFHPTFSYEEFIEGLRIDSNGSTKPEPGAFLEWNEAARKDKAHKYVLLIEELTRANVPSVFGELLTYVEHRDRCFETLFSRTRTSVSENLTIMATFNPVDRSAIMMDDALLRRIRMIDFPPDEGQLAEMLSKGGRSMPPQVIVKLQALFSSCRAAHPDTYEALMPFGHGIFNEAYSEADLYDLWRQRLKRILRRPTLDPHPFAETIEDGFPWRKSPAFRLAPPVSAPTSAPVPGSPAIAPSSP